MVTWWAVSLVLGLIFPSAPISAPLCMLLTIMIAWAGGRSLHRMRLFAIYASTSLLIWTGASLMRPASGRSARARSGPNLTALSAVRTGIAASLEDGNLSDRSEALLAALVLADRARLDDEVRESYAYLGIAHFLALSGLHLGAIIGPLVWIAARLPARRAARDGFILASIAFYTAVTDFPPSLVRAAALAFAFMLQRRVGRRTTLARSLSLGLLALLLLDSEIVLDGGFQLSCAAVYAIALIGIPLLELIGSGLPEGRWGRMTRIALAPVILTVSINAFTLPLVLLFFKRAPILAPLFNLGAVLPVTTLLYLGLLYLAVPVQALRALLAVPLDLLAELLWEMPVRMAVGPQPALYAGDVLWIPYCAGMLLLVAAVRPCCSRRRVVISLSAGLIAASVAGASLPGKQPPDTGAAPSFERVSRRAAFLDGGQRILFIEDDLGRREAVRLLRRLWAEGVHRIDRLVICPARLRQESGVYHLLARLEVCAVSCSPYLVSCGERFAAVLEERGPSPETLARDDSIAVGRAVVLLKAPAYPPPRGSSVPMGAAKVRYEISYDAAVRENAN